MEEEKIYGGSIKVAGMDPPRASLANIQIARVIFIASAAIQPAVSEDHPKKGQQQMNKCKFVANNKL